MSNGTENRNDTRNTLSIILLIVVLSAVAFSSNLFGYGTRGSNRKFIFLPPPSVQKGATTQIAFNPLNPLPKNTDAKRFQFTRVLSYGAVGSDVAKLQQILKDQGVYIPPVSGFFGLYTYQSLVTFQGDRSLPPTGYLDASTRALLNTMVK